MEKIWWSRKNKEDGDEGNSRRWGWNQEEQTVSRSYKCVRSEDVHHESPLTTNWDQRMKKEGRVETQLVRGNMRGSHLESEGQQLLWISAEWVWRQNQRWSAGKETQMEGNASNRAPGAVNCELLSLPEADTDQRSGDGHNGDAMDGSFNSHENSWETRRCKGRKEAEGTELQILDPVFLHQIKHFYFCIY